MPELSTIYDYMRAHASLLGARILLEYPALPQFEDPVSPRIENLLRKPFPAQTIAIMGLAKRWHEARTAMVIVIFSNSWPEWPRYALTRDGQFMV
jgi:hypothetical protein